MIFFLAYCVWRRFHIEYWHAFILWINDHAVDLHSIFYWLYVWKSEICSLAILHNIVHWSHRMCDMSSLRSKRSYTKWAKFGQCVLVFRIQDARKMGREQKGGRKGMGEGKEGNACLQTPWFLKTRSPTKGALNDSFARPEFHSLRTRKHAT